MIVTFNVPAAVLAACLDSVRHGGDCDHVIVVDNGGWAATEVIRQEVNKAQATSMLGAPVELVTPGRNLGYGGAANVGFRRAAELGATAVALLNDDVEVEPGWLRPLLQALDADASLGAVQPKLLIAASEKAAGPARVNSVGVEVGGDGAGRDIGYGQPDGPQFSAEREIGAFTGGAVLFRSAFLEQTGGFDESYFLYYEDLDLARRGAALGWHYRCAPASVIHHRVSASTEQLGHQARYFQERNRLRFAFRHGTPRAIVGALWLSLRRLRWAPRSAHARALLGGLTAAPRAFVSRARHGR